MKRSKAHRIGGDLVTDPFNEFPARCIEPVITCWAAASISTPTMSGCLSLGAGLRRIAGASERRRQQASAHIAAHAWRTHAAARISAATTTTLPRRQWTGVRWVGSIGWGHFSAPGLSTAYSYGNVAVTRDWGPLRAELSYIRVQRAGYRRYMAGPAGGPLVLSVSWRF